MNLNQIRYFSKLAEEQHFTKAAKELDITQPSLSHAINCLEEELGTKLFEKRGRGVVLTKYGQVFRQYTDDALKTLDEGVKKIRTMTGQTEGLVEIAYIYTLGSSFVPQLVSDFVRTHEELRVKFSFTVGNTAEVVKGIKDGQFDLGFCSMKEQEEEVFFTPVGTENLIVAVPKGHPLSGMKSVDLGEAALYPQICYTKNSGLRPVIDRMFRQEGILPEIAYEIEEDGCMAGLVAQNFGIAVMPEIPVLKSLGLDILPIRNQRQKRYIYMAEPADRYRPPIVRKFCEYVKERTKDYT